MCHDFLALVLLRVTFALGSLLQAHEHSVGLRLVEWSPRVHGTWSTARQCSAIIEANGRAYDSTISDDSLKGYKTVTAEDLLSKIGAGTRYILLDCRPEEEFKAGHVPGAVNISVDSYTFGAQTVLKSALVHITVQVGKKTDFVLIDGSSNEEYMPRAKLLELIRSLPEDRCREVILYCRKPECTRSPMAIRWALAAGYKNLWRFPGGWKEWSEKKYPVEKP